MGVMSESSACLRIFGDDLKPDEITSLLGSEPTASDKKGHPKHTQYVTEQIILSKHGSWLLESKRKCPGNLDSQIKEVLQKLTNDLTIWKELSLKYKVDMFCGLWLETYNEGISLSTETLKSLSERYIFIDFDIYHVGNEEE